MKKILSVISISAMLMASLPAFASGDSGAETPMAVSNHSISLQIVGLEYGYEQRLGGSFSMVFRGGLVPAGLSLYNDMFNFGFQAAMKLGVSVEPRYYTNFDRRTRLGKTTFKNSGDFVAMKVQSAFGGVFVYEDEDGDVAFSSKTDISLTPMYGIRRVWGKHWFGEFSVGARIGWQSSFYAVPYLQYRLGFVF